MISQDILGRDLEVGQWVAMPWRYSSSQGLRVRQISSVQDRPIIRYRGVLSGPTRKVFFFRQTNRREQEITNACVILDGYDGPEVG